MQDKESIVRASSDQLQALRNRGESASDWQAADSMSQHEIERLADEDDGPLPEGWESTVEIGIRATKQAIHLRLDRDLLAWFRAHVPGYQTRINAALRAFVQARREAESGKRNSG